MQESVMAMLREGTSADHAAAERQPFQRALVMGGVTRGAYAAYLTQMLAVHSTLEARLAACADPALRRVVTAEQSQAGNLKADLEALGAGVTGPLPATQALVASLEDAAGPGGLLGSLYVLEGSKNGAAYIARAIRRSLGLEPARGDRYLDPHGAAQKEVWAAFKARMDAESWGGAARDEMLRDARAMFRAIEAISAELEQQFLAVTA